MDRDSAIEELLGEQTICFWDGLPPCPKCGRDHGDPKATPEKDRERRRLLDGREWSEVPSV